MPRVFFFERVDDDEDFIAEVFSSALSVLDALVAGGGGGGRGGGGDCRNRLRFRLPPLPILLLGLVSFNGLNR